MDIGCTTDIEMDNEIDNSKPRIQKYYTLPLNVRGVRKILDQMLEYGILRECPESSNFVSNLLVTKKSNGDIRILLDRRLLNNATIRKLVSPTQHRRRIFLQLTYQMHFSKYLLSTNISAIRLFTVTLMENAIV
jgi:hypothetical protein